MSKYTYVTRIISTIKEKDINGLESILNEIDELHLPREAEVEMGQLLLKEYGIKDEIVKEVNSRIYRIASNLMYFESKGLNVKKVVERAPSLLAYDSSTLEEHWKYLENKELNVKKVVEGAPSLLAYDPNTIEEHWEYLKGKGLNVKKVVEGAPRLLARDPSAIEEHWEYLKGKGLNVKKVVERAPSLLAYDPNTIEEHWEYLENKELNVKKVVERAPTLLYLDPSTLEEHWEYLENKELNVKKVVERAPSLLARDPNTIEEHYRTLENIFKENTKSIIEKHPILLGISKTTIENNYRSLIKLSKKYGFEIGKINPWVFTSKNLEERINYFTSLGFDVVKSINYLVNLSLEKNIKPKVKFLTEVVGISTETIAKNLYYLRRKNELEERWDKIKKKGIHIERYPEEKIYEILMWYSKNRFESWLNHHEIKHLNEKIRT